MAAKACPDLFGDAAGGVGVHRFVGGSLENTSTTLSSDTNASSQGELGSSQSGGAETGGDGAGVDGEPSGSTDTLGVVATGGASEVYKRVRFDVGETTLIDTTVVGFLRGEADAIEGQSLVVQLDVEGLDRMDWRLSSVSLVDPDGEPLADGRIYDHLGSEIRPLRFRTRGFAPLFVAFEEIEVPANLIGWGLRIAHEDEMPLYLPLDGPAYARNYPFPLAHGEESVAWSGNFGGCAGDGLFMDTLVDSAIVSLDRGDDRGRHAEPGERFLTVRLAMSNPNQEQGANCGQLVLWPDFAVTADGGGPSRAIESSSGNVERGATRVVIQTFSIPASATSVELLGGRGDEPLATWDLSMPEAVGEVGPVGRRQDPAPQHPELELATSPPQLTTTQLGAGGATGGAFDTTFTLGPSMSTNASVDSIVAGAGERDELGYTFVTSEITLDSNERASWDISSRSVTLEDSNGRTFAAVGQIENGEFDTDSIKLRGEGIRTVTYVFRVHGFVTDMTGWQIAIHPESKAPFRLPIDGEAERLFPIPLSTGASRDFSLNKYGGCSATDGDEINATVERAEITLERRDSFGDIRRVSSGARFIRVDLALTNQVPGPFSSGTANCGAVVLWVPFLVRADGRFFQPSLSVDLLNIDYESTETLTVVVPIPADTQSIEIYGGIDPTLIAGWELLGNAEVLQNFKAEDQADEKLVTLDDSVLFAFGSAELSEAAVQPLTRLTNVLLDDSTGPITITGHTDSIGTDESNNVLSLARAQAVVAFMVDAGIDPGRLTAVGAGEANPIAPNEFDDGSDNPLGRAENRRVEILFTITN